MYAFLERDIIWALGTWEEYKPTQTAPDIYLPTNTTPSHLCIHLQFIITDIKKKAFKNTKNLSENPVKKPFINSIDHYIHTPSK